MGYTCLFCSCQYNMIYRFYCLLFLPTNTSARGGSPSKECIINSRYALTLRQISLGDLRNVGILLLKYVLGTSLFCDT